MLRSAVILGLLLALLALPGPADAFICTRVVDDFGFETGPSLSWSKRDLTYALYAQGTNDITGAEEFDALRASFAPWGRIYNADGTLEGDPPTETIDDCALPPDTCRTTNLTFREAEELSNRDVVGYDFLRPESNENLLIFRDDAWPVAAQASSVIALTTTTYNALTGDILDADIEFNSANNSFTVDDVYVETDLMNTAVHEIGHYLGLGHVGDDNREATMYDTAGRREIKKRDLDFDDRNGIVFKYPWGDENGYCDPPIATCGFCAPPDELTAIATATATSHDLGLESEGCAALSPMAWAALAALLLGRRRRCGRG